MEATLAMGNSGHRGLRQRLRRIARQIDAQHRSLARFEEILCEALTASPGVDAALACRRYRDALRAHFELEEGLFFPALHGFDRSTEAILIELQNGHDALERELEELLSLIVGKSEKAKRALDGLLTRLNAHERSEQRLWKLIE